MYFLFHFSLVLQTNHVKTVVCAFRLYQQGIASSASAKQKWADSFAKEEVAQEPQVEGWGILRVTMGTLQLGVVTASSVIMVMHVIKNGQM